MDYRGTEGEGVLRCGARRRRRGGVRSRRETPARGQENAALHAATGTPGPRSGGRDRVEFSNITEWIQHDDSVAHALEGSVASDRAELEQTVVQEAPVQRQSRCRGRRRRRHTALRTRQKRLRQPECHPPFDRRSSATARPGRGLSWSARAQTERAAPAPEGRSSATLTDGLHPYSGGQMPATPLAR